MNDFSATFRLALRMLRRDLRAGELTLLGIALALAVAALSSVAFLTGRVEAALKLQSHQLLGGDLLLTADHPWQPELRAHAAALGLRVAESVTFPSMAATADAVQLADIKAVSAAYPLRGALRVAAPGGDRVVRGVPPRGEAWGDERLFSDLGLARGDGVSLGGVRFAVSEVLVLEPDRGFNAFNLAPRLMINTEDLAATGLLQEGSRARWRLHLAGEAAAVERFREWAAPRLGRGEKMEDLDNARPEVKVMLDRAQRFFSLAAMLAVVLAAVAITLSVNRYVRRHLDGCAVMRCLGAPNRTVLGVHLGEFALFGMAATALGCLAGYLIQHALVLRLASLVGDATLPAAGWRPWALGCGVGLVLMLGSVLPPLLRLRTVPALGVLRREWGDASAWPQLRVWLAGALALAALMLWIAADLRLGLIVIGGFLLVGAVYAGLTLLLLGLLRGLASSGAAHGWRLGLAGLYRRRRSTLIQTVALAVGLTTLLLLTAGRADLLAAWKTRVPPDAPNRFVINIQPEQREAVAAFFRERRATVPAEPLLEPMIRARLVSINGRPVVAEAWADERARRLVEREFNLSWAARLQVGNEVVAGRWFAPDARAEFSVEQGLAQDIGLKVGDELGYDIAGSAVSGRVTSIRKLEWDSMRVNFFVVGTPHLLRGQPGSFITSFHLGAGREAVATELVRAFPNLTVIDVASLVRQIEGATDQAVRAIEAVFGFAVLAGIVVLVAVFHASHDERVREMAILRALGARRRQLLSALLAESLGLGSLAGLLAALGAGGLGWALAHWVFRLPYVPGPELLLLALTTGIALAALGGWFGLRRVANASPIRVLASEVG